MKMRASGGDRQTACYLKSTFEMKDLDWLPTLDTFRTFASLNDLRSNLVKSLLQKHFHLVDGHLPCTGAHHGHVSNTPIRRRPEKGYRQLPVER